MKSLNTVRRLLLKLAVLTPLTSMARAQPNQLPLTKIAFGSCLHQDKPQTIWNAVLAENPDVFIFLGDNIYGDSDDPGVLRSKYQQLAAKPGFQQLKARTRLLATWDDHDYGRNDAGLEYPSKIASRELMLDFWNEPEDSPRRNQDGGIYTSVFVGNSDQRVQIILLDLRWNRTALSTVDSFEALQERSDLNMGPYVLNPDENAQLLGEEQWRWLESQMEQDADVRIIGSSIQVLADFTGWEAWLNYPNEYQRLLQLLENHQEIPNLIISGDVHWCELSQLSHPAFQQPLTELTSSGLTETWEDISPNINRASKAYAVPNFGLIEIDWSGRKPSIKLTVKNENSEVLISHLLS